MLNTFNGLNKKNFRIKKDHIMLIKPINGITSISLPSKKLMPWIDAMAQKGNWQLPTIEELKTVFNICIFLQIDLKLTERVWSSTSVTNYEAKALNFNNGTIETVEKELPLEVIYICR